mmetsp:Transcript_32104/g.45648  ORF Transcript_32104/g.45648 Transcript_32104/m.45648 type:complete len:96 (+) Transcript_32104:146-433(+)
MSVVVVPFQKTLQTIESVVMVDHGRPTVSAQFHMETEDKAFLGGFSFHDWASLAYVTRSCFLFTREASCTDRVQAEACLRSLSNSEWTGPLQEKK